VPDLRIRRDHDLGLPEARKIAQDWVRSAQEQLHMACTYHPGEAMDRIAFTRSGVSGELRVAGDRFELDAKLGFLLGAFKDRIEQEVSNNLDALLAKPRGTPAGPV
jgi:putative polyhydroxyalkanoate system protein